MTCYTLSHHNTGASRASLHYALQHSPAIHHLQRDLLTSYYLLYWSGSYILRASTLGRITHKGISYIVCYDPKCSRGRILSDPLAQYTLSFRAPLPCFQLPAYCYIGN